jgi:hypothetical protein
MPVVVVALKARQEHLVLVVQAAVVMLRGIRLLRLALMVWVVAVAVGLLLQVLELRTAVTAAPASWSSGTGYDVCSAG